MSVKWLGGRKAARFAALALHDWLRSKSAECDGDLGLQYSQIGFDKGGWDWNDTTLIEIAIRELERISDHVTEAERLRTALQIITERLDPQEQALLIKLGKAALG